MSSSMGIDASLSLLRHELEGMQQQDKAIYSQLLTLQESIRGLKTELRREREECEEAFKDLEEISGKEFEDDNEVFLENLENESEVLNTRDGWKHDRQDSGISVKTPEAETQDITSKYISQDEVDSRGFVPKPGIILHNKHDLDATDVKLTQKTTVESKPGLIQHGKQDSGILIDEEAVRDTKLLSRLVESCEMFEKLENRKFDRIIQDRWQKARGENPLVNRSEVRDRPLVNRSEVGERPLVDRESKYQHQRSRSSNDILLKPQPQRTLPGQFSGSSLRPLHSHTNSCPQTALKHGKELQKQLESVEKSPFKQFFELDIELNEKLGKENLKTESSSQRKELQTGKEFQPFRKTSFKQFSQLDIDLNEKLHKDNLITNDGFSQMSPTPSTPTALGQGATSPIPQSVLKLNFIQELNERQQKSRVDNSKTNYGSTQRPPTPSTPTALGQSATSSVPKSPLKSNFTFKHSHSRSLPVTSMREFVTQERQLSRKENRRSMENISDHKVVPAHHVRPRQRSASVVDLDSCDVTQSKGSPRQDTSHKTSVVHVDSLNQYNDVIQNKAVHIAQGEVKAAKPLRAVLVSASMVSASEVNVSNITDRQTLSRKRSLDEIKTGNYRASDVTQRRLTLTNFKTDRRLSPRLLSPGLLDQNTQKSPRFLSPQASRNHLRHHTMPEYDVMRRRHSFIWHAPSKSWDGYARKPKEVRGLTRSVSQVSFV